MNIKCSACNRKITKPGALVFSPPTDGNLTQKFHLCTDCWIGLYLLIDNNELCPTE